MGPQLGPLVVTAVRVQMSSYQRARLRRLGLYAGIGDSKQVSAFGKMAWCEAIALAAVERATGTLAPDIDSLLDLVSLEPRKMLVGRCPKASYAQCWSAEVLLPVWANEHGKELEQARRVMARMAGWGVELEYVASRVVCVRHFNDAFADVGSKTTVDLRQMQALLEDSSSHSARVDESGEDHRAVCGMVGGIRSYPKFWSDRDALSTIAESRKRCAYRFGRYQELSFEVAADDRHMPVALASMVGKYIRELWMLRQNRFYQDVEAGVPAASGYHDPVTRTHIARTARARKRLGIAKSCFLRVR